VEIKTLVIPKIIPQIKLKGLVST